MGRTYNLKVVRQKTIKGRTYNKPAEVVELKLTEKIRKARLKAEKKAKEEAEK